MRLQCGMREHYMLHEVIRLASRWKAKGDGEERRCCTSPILEFWCLVLGGGLGREEVDALVQVGGM